MTNWEVMKFVIDNGTEKVGIISYENVITDNIKCPYQYEHPEGMCYGKPTGYDRQRCIECKEKWLKEECGEQRDCGWKLQKTLRDYYKQQE